MINDFDVEFFRIKKDVSGKESIVLNEDKINIVKLLKRISDNAINTEKECDEKIKIIEDILNLPEEKEFTIPNIIETNKKS